MESYRVPTRDSETEFIEKKSRFIGRIWVVETEEEALARLKEMRAREGVEMKKDLTSSNPFMSIARIPWP